MRASRPFAVSTPLAAAIGSVLGIALPGAAWSQSTITTPGDSARDLGTRIETPGGGVYDVHAGRTRGSVDFNSFGRFEVGVGDTVNLHLTGGANTVVNLVWDARALIDGTLNSLKDGNIGGRVVFADSHGLVVGQSGVLNVGSLAVATPTTGFMEQLASGNGAVVDAATVDLLRGTIPLSNGTVDIRGTINARDDVRIQARAVDVTGTVWVAGGTGANRLDSAVAVNTGAGDGVRLVNDGGNILLVARDSLAVSGTLHADGGDVVLQADDSVRVNAGAVLNTRDVASAGDPLAASASTGASGDILVAGRDINVAAGALLDAHATGAHAAGDISIEAADRATVQTGLARASSRAHVDGTLRGGDIDISATTIADSSWTDPDADPATIAGNQLVEVAQLAGTLIGGNLGYLAADTRAEVEIGRNARIEATGDVNAHARTQQTIETVVTGLRGSQQLQDVLSIGAVYADLDTVASAKIAAGAVVEAGGTLDVSAETENTLDIAVTSFAADGTAVAMTVAVSTIDVAADASIADGAVLDVGALRVDAHNQSSFSTSAVARSDKDGMVGLAAAVSLQDVSASAHLGADVDTAGDVVIEAASLVDGNATDTMVAEPLSTMTTIQRQIGGDADGGNAIAGLMGQGFARLKGALGEQKDDDAAATPVPFRLGAAMTYTDGAHAARATLGDGAIVRADGDVAIHAGVVDAGIAITSGSAIDAKGEDADNPGSTFSLSAGVAITNLRHDAVAEVGDGAAIQARNVGVGSEVVLPMDFSALGAAVPDFSSFGAFIASLDAAKSVVKKPWELFTSYASASSAADDLALGGVINHYRVINNSRAWVGEGARLTSTAAAGSAGWESTLAGDSRKANWDQSIAVTALTDSQSLHAAGDMELELSRVGAGKDGAAVGGSFNNIVYDTTTIAGIASGAVVVTDAGVAVDATTRDNVVSLALMAGSGSSIGIDGTMALLDVSSTTRASLSRDASVTAAGLDIDALQDLFVWSVSGALAMGNSLSVGLGVGIHNLSTDTRAYVGDNAADAPGVMAVTAPVENTAGSGAIRTDALSVQAQSTGLAGAVAVAGAVTRSNNAPDPNAKPGFVDKLKTSAQGKVDGLRAGAADRFAQLPGLSSIADKVRGEQGAGASDEKPAEPKFGISVSGSASVNLIAQETRAYLDGAAVAGRGGNDTRVDVAAINDTTLASASGSAAITLAKADSSKFSAAIGGAVSYSMVDNDTAAYVSASELADANDVAVRALSGGEQTNVALGVSVNKSTNQQSAVSMAGSFSIGRSSNDTRAWLTGSTLSGGNASDRMLDIGAYGRTHVGVGAGSLYFGGRGGIGAAFTYAEIADSTSATIDGGSISDYDDVSLRALDAARIVAGAAMAGGGGESNGLSGAVVYNNVDNVTRARIGNGATLDIDGDLLVQARGTAPVKAFEDRLRTIGSDPEEGFDYRGGALTVDVDGVDADLANAGTSIIAVAGLVQVGKNNIGLSFVGNEVDNTHVVEIANAQLDVGNAARLDAADSTAILGLSIGAGVATGKFAGMGNATANMIGNRTQVLIGDAGAAADTTRIDAGSLHASAVDASLIGSLAGNVAIGSKAALGAAVTYNDIGNTTSVEATRTRIDSSGAVTLAAENQATILAGAIAGAFGSSAGISGSFAWSEIGNDTLASLGNSRIDARSLDVSADSTSDIFTLSGAVSGSGTAAVGAAINIATIGDSTRAVLENARVAVDDDISVAASGSGVARSLAVAGAASGNVAVGGSSSNAIVANTIAARASNLGGLTAGSGAGADGLTVSAQNTGEAHSLAGAVSASSNVAVGGAISINHVGGSTTATLEDSLLAVREEVAVEATSNALINTVAGTGSFSNVGIAGAATTNVITGSTRATLANTALNDTGTDTAVVAVDSSQINSIAGSLGFGGNVGVGAAVAVNVIDRDVGAHVLGGAQNRRYHGRNLLVSAEANNDGALDGGNINTIAAGVGGGGTVGGAASVAVNVIEGSVTAEIGQGADVVAEHNVGVIAGNTQGINVFAGSLGIGGSAAGIGLGTVVNVIDASTQALIQGSGTRVSALAKDASDRMAVDAGDVADAGALAVSDVQALGDYVAPDLRGNTLDVTGLAVNASTRQHVATLGVSGAVSFNPVGGVSLAAMAGVNVVGGQTRALIEDAQVNQHAGMTAGSGQQVDVRASSHSMGANFIAGIAAGAGGSASGALATNVFDNVTEAGIDTATVAARDGVVVGATSSQNSLVVAAGLAAGLAGGAGTGVVNVFQSSTDAFVRGGSLDVGTLTIDAESRNAASLVGGAVAVGALAMSGTLLVNVSETSTRASLDGTDVDTNGDVALRAHTDTEFQGIAVSGALAGGNALAGMAQVNVIGNTTEASISGADVSAAGNVSVDAIEELALRAYSGALAVDVGGGVGIGAGANVTVLGSKVRAAVVDSDIRATGDLDVRARADRDVEMVAMTAGAGLSAGIGGGAGLLLSGVGAIGDSGSELGTTFARLGDLGGGDKIDAAVIGGSLDANRLQRVDSASRHDLTGAMNGRADQVIAVLSGGDIAADAVTVAAENLLSTRNLAGGLGVGGVGVGGAFAFTGLYGETRAGLENTHVDARGDIAVEASNRDGAGGASARLEAYAGGAGIVGLGAAVAVARVEQTVSAEAGGQLDGQGGSLSVTASDSGSIDVDAIGAAVGAAAAGIVVADARRSSTVEAALLANATVGGFRGLLVDAASNGAVSAYGLGAAGGILAAGTGVGVTARDDIEVIASIGDDAEVDVTANGVDVRASARPDVSAEGLGVAAAGYVALGAVIVDAGSSARVHAEVGDDVALVGSGGLRVSASAEHATGTTGVRAKSTAGTGGVFLSANAATAKAHNSSQVIAETGSGLRLPDGDVSITARNLTRQDAQALGVAVGGIAVGAVVVDAESSTVTRASLGNGAAHHAANGAVGNLTVDATGVDRNAAHGIAGSGGLVAGNAAVARTRSVADVDATIGDDVDLVASGDVHVDADHDARYAGQADSTNAAVIGGSGANVSNYAHANVHAGIGDATAVLADGDIGVRATNRFTTDLASGQIAVHGAAGGVISGSAAGVDTQLHGTTTATVGGDAELLSGLDASRTLPGDISVVAATIANTHDSASLSTGGAIDVARVSANLGADFSNAVDIGNDAWLASQGYVNLGTYTRAFHDTSALVNTWGLAAVGIADSDVRLNSAQSVDVGRGALIESLNNTYVTAGRDATGMHDTRFMVNSVAEGYVRGVIAVPDASASADVTSNADTRIHGGSHVLSASNVTGGAYTGETMLNASGVGRGYQLGFIPVTQRDSTSNSRGTGTLTVDGSLLAGRYNELDISVDASGNLVHHKGMPVFASKDSAFRPREFLDALCVGGNDSDGCKALTALRNSVAQGPVNAWTLGPMFAAGGDVFLHGSTIAGSGDVTAQGAPSIRVVNNSDHYLLLDQIAVPDYEGGRVRFTGVAGSAPSLTLNQEPASARPSVFIHNAWQGSDGPAIFAMDSIRNIGGLVHLRNDQGSLGQFGTVYAQQQIVEAPNGIVTFANINADWFSGSNPQSDWRARMLRPSDPNDAVAYIANYVYGSNNLTNTLLYRGAPDGNYAGSSIVLYGGCAPHTSNDGCGVGPYGTQNFYGRPMPIVPGRTLSRVINNYSENPDVATNAANSSFRGQQIYVRARYIDVNSTIDAGAGTNWSLKVLDETGLSSWLQGLDTIGQGRYEIPPQYLTTIGTGSNRINAWYDAANRRIVVDNVNASGGGYVYLDGRIVSTTPHGKIKVSSGFGEVRIDSDIDRAVQLQDINVGNGAVGVVEIVDREKGSAGNPYVTWYVSRQGQNPVAYDNRFGAISYDDANAFRLDNAGTYNPQAGMRYRWTERANVARGSRHDGWQWTNGSYQVVDAGQEWRTLNAGFYRGTAGGPVFEQNITGSFSSFAGQNVTYGCSGRTGGCNYGFPILSRGENEWNPERGDDGGWQTRWYYQYALRGQINLNASVKADNAIAIDFSGAGSGLIDVDARGDLLLGGRLWNPGGRTELTTVGTVAGGIGDIIRTSDTAMITTRDLAIDATGGIGVGGRGPLQVTLTPGGSLVGSSGSRGVFVDVHSDAAVHINAGKASGYGDVVLTANGDITGLAGRAHDIAGRDITLRSLYGGIGGSARPLILRANETVRSDNGIDGGRVSAFALNDIALRDTAGDFWVDSVVSEAGDVHLHAAAGALLDASLRTGADVLSEEEIARIRQNLRLDGSGVDDSVAAFERQVEARYQEYWRLRGLGQVQDGVYTPGTQAIALFRGLAEAATGEQGLSDAQVRDYIVGRYATLEGFFTDTLGAGWAARGEFQQYDDAFAYAVAAGSQQHDDLSRNAVWTDAQLRYAINASALEPSGGGVGAAEPTVSGRNVTLHAATGIGRLASDLDIDYAALQAGNLDSEQALALALANTPGDVLMIGADGEVLTRDQLLALTEADIANGAIASIRIKRTSPLFIEASGRFDGSTAGNAYVQARGDLRIGEFEAGGDARLAASGSIVDAAPGDGAAVSVGGDLVLNAGNGNIGGENGENTAAQALALDIAGRLLSASAGQNALIRQIAGDLRFGTVFANGLASLAADGGGLHATLDGISIDARSIQLAARDDIGRRDAGTASGLDGALQLRVSPSGQLDGEAGGRAWISSPDRALNIGTLRSGLDLDLAVGGGNLHAGELTSTGGSVNAGSEGDTVVVRARAQDMARITAIRDLAVDDLIAGQAELLAGRDVSLNQAVVSETLDVAAIGAMRLVDAADVRAAAVQIDAASLDMGAGSTIAARDTIDIATSGDMQLGRLVVSGRDPDARIDLRAGGRIDGNGDPVVHLVGGANVAAELSAGNGIGLHGSPLRVSVGLLDGHSAQDDIHLHLPDGGRIGSMIAADGDLAIDADNHLEFGLLAAQRALRLGGTDARGTTLRAGVEGLDVDMSGLLDVASVEVAGDAAVRSGGDTTITTLGVGGSLIADAGNDLKLATAAIGSDANLSSGRDTSIATLDVGGTLTADAGNDLTIDVATIGIDAQLRSGAATRLGPAVIGRDLDATAGTTFAATQLQVGGNATVGATDVAVAEGDVTGNASLASLEATTLDRFAVGGTLDATTGTHFVAADLTVGGNATLESGGDTTIAALDVGGNLIADAGNDLKLDTATIGRDATLTSGHDTTISTLDVGGNLIADAGNDLTIDTATIGHDARLTSGRDTSIATLDVGGTLTADAGNDLTIDVATIGVDAQLRSGAATRLGPAVIGRDLDATAGTTFAATQLQVGRNVAIGAAVIDIVDGDVTGNASLTSLAAMTLGRFTVGGTLDATAGSDLVATDLTVGGNATLESGGDTTISALDVGGNLIADAGNDLKLATAVIGSDANLTSGRDTSIATLDVGGTLTADAGNDLTIDVADIGIDAQLRSGAAIRLGTAVIGRDLDATAGTTFAATQLQVGRNAAIGAAVIEIVDGDVTGNASLTSLAAMTLGRFNVGGTLDATAGSDLVATDLTVGGNATLESGGDTRIGTVTTTGVLGTRAGRDMVLQHGRIGMDATLLAARDMALGDIATVGRMVAEAGRDLHFARLDSGMDIAATARTGHVIGGSANADTALRIDAAGDIRFDRAIAGTQADFVAGRNVFGRQLRADTTDVRVDAGRDIDLDEVDAARDVLLWAGNGIRLGGVGAGRVIDIDAGTGLGFGDLDAAHELRLRSRHGDITGQSLHAGSDALVTAAQSVKVGDSTVGRDYVIDAGRDAALGRYRVGATTTVAAGRNIAIDDGHGVGTQRLAAGGGITFGSIAGEAEIRMHARGGAIAGGLLEAPDAYLSARERIGLDLARIDSRLNLDSAEILANVEQTGSGDQPIAMVLTGYEGGVARRVVLSVDARDAWVVDRLWAMQAELDTTAEQVDIHAGRIEDSMRLVTPVASLWMHNRSTALQPADVQLYQPRKAFLLSQHGNRTFSDAYVVRYGEGFEVQAPNHLPSHEWTDVDYYAESALRFTSRTLQESSWAWQGLARHPFSSWRSEPASDEEPIETIAGAVNTGISP